MTESNINVEPTSISLLSKTSYGGPGTLEPAYKQGQQYVQRKLTLQVGCPYIRVITQL